MKKAILILLTAICGISASATDTTKPWTFWYWMYGCVSDEGIRLDLKGMKDAGIAGFYLMPIKDVSDGPQYDGHARQLSPEWWSHMQTVFHVADSLGLEMGIHFSDGFALGGGPWITPEESMQRIVWTDTIVDIKKGGIDIRQPESKEGYYEDIATYAIPLLEKPDMTRANASVEFPYRSTEPCDIIFSYDKPTTVRSVRIITGGNNYQAHRWQVYASDDNINYRHVRDIEPARQGWQNTDAYATYSIPTTTARYFKFHWTPEGSDPGSEDMDAAKWRPVLKVADIVLGSAAVIDGFEGKSGLAWRVSKRFPLADADCIDPSEIITITLKGSHIDDLPTGTWRILRMGHTTTGHTNATGGGGRGLECDKFSRQAIRKQLKNWFGAIHQRAPRNVLRRLHVDSWECGSQNWSDNFAEEFSRRRGYDLLPWLPLYAGVPMENSEQSDKVLRDIRQTIAELIDEVFFDEVEKGARNYGVQLSAECVAPTMVSDGLLHYRHVDYPMGEFWLNSPTHDKPNDMLDAISGAHIYGKPIIQAEGFTEVRGTWDETPAMLKPLLDRNYCLGINSIVFHVNTHNPWTDRKPGMTLDGIGTFFQRDNTWWREMPSFSSYITHCQRWLQEGKPVVDLAVYAGDEVPRRAILPERLISILPGLFGEAALKRETERLLNKGQPMETSPVGVSHTLNMTKAEAWTNPLHGYKYDTFNHDVLNGMRVENGRIVTSNGMTYSAIVVPGERKMNPDNINTGKEILERLRNQGANIIEAPWTSPDLSGLGLLPDVVLPEGIDFAHRKTDTADIYFFCNLNGETVRFTPQCRDKRQFSHLFDPMTGNTTEVQDTLTLTPYASIFYLWTDTDEMVDKSQHTPNATGKAKEVPIDGEWTLTFESNDIILKTTLDKGWEEYDDPKVKYYSGHATYATTFKHKAKGKTFIDLGEVGDIATVYVNDICCGTTWLPPHRLDITKAVRRGKNTLRIVVTNTWANALLGADNGTPPFEGIWTNGKYRRAEKTPLPAGLKGKVMLITQ